jgi:hypothetical protein
MGKGLAYQEGDDFGEEIEASLFSRELVALLMAIVLFVRFWIILHQKLREGQPLGE